MKLKVGDAQTFFQWRSQAIQDKFHARLLDVQKLSTLPLRWHVKEIEVVPASSVTDVIRKLTGKEPITVKQKNSPSRKITTERYLYCLSASSNKLELSTSLADYDIQEGDVLLLGEDVKEERSPYLDFSMMISPLMISVRDITDFCALVVTAEDVAASVKDHYTSSLNEYGHINSVLLYTDEDSDLAQYIRYNFSSLSEMTGNNFFIHVIEQPTQSRDVSVREYWKAVLEQNAYSFLHLLGWTRYKPYDKADAYKIARMLGVYPDTLPCIILFGNLENDEKIVLKITGEFQTLFRRLTSVVIRTIEKLWEAQVELYHFGEINFDEFKKAFLEAWDLEQGESGEKQNQGSTFYFSGNTVFINRPSGQFEMKDFQNE
jgi:hypothetical protein